MNGMDWVLELVLVGLLCVTLLHAIRLERALGLLHRDRAAFGEAIASFDSSARQAEAGLGRIHAAAAEAGHSVARRTEHAVALKDDLAFLCQRGETLADRLDALVRSGRVQGTPEPDTGSPHGGPRHAGPVPADSKVRSQAERDLLLALRTVQ